MMVQEFRLETEVGDITLVLITGKNIAYCKLLIEVRSGRCYELTVRLSIYPVYQGEQFHIQCQEMGCQPLPWWEYAGYRVECVCCGTDRPSQPGYNFFHRYVQPVLKFARQWCKDNPRQVEKWKQSWQWKWN